MIAVVTPGHPVKAGAGYDCACGECLHRRAVLRAALADAAAWREERGGGYCRDCELHPAGLCEAHGEDLDLAQAYLEMLHEMEGARA